MIINMEYEIFNWQAIGIFSIINESVSLDVGREMKQEA
jgi:hypothetical protein